ncbi:MAG: hypothetical protein LBH24_02625 [Clostridiales bacterium]|jgi:hypothetical protein|nr:hypothetical protein [Clostridiales bacterium]
MKPKKPLHKKVKLIRLYKTLAVVLMLLLLFMPNSIARDVEIETKLLLTVLGIDRTDDGYEVSGLAVLPEETQNSNIVKLMVRGEGLSIRKALDDISSKMGKTLELSLCGSVVWGDNFKEDGIIGAGEYLLSSGFFSPGVYLLQANKLNARDILAKSIELNDATITRMSKLVEHNQTGLNVPTTTLLKFIEETQGVSRASYMPAIEIAANKPSGGGGQAESGASQSAAAGGGTETKSAESGGGSSGSGNCGGGCSGSGNSGGGGGETTGVLSMENVFLFKGGRKIKLLTKEETRGLAWTDERSNKGHYVIENFIYDGVNMKIFNLRLTDKKCRLETKIENGVPKAALRVRLHMMYEDKYKLHMLWSEYGHTQEELNKAVERALQKSITAEIKSAVDEMQGCNCDAFQFTPNMYQFHTKAYRAVKDKLRLFADTAVEYDVKVSLL